MGILDVVFDFVDVQGLGSYLASQNTPGSPNVGLIPGGKFFLSNGS